MKKPIKRIFQILIIPLFLYNTGCSQNDNNSQIEKTIHQLEKSFKMRSIQFVEPYLSNEFIINDMEPLFSKQLLAILASGFPLKKIKNAKVVSKTNDTLFVKCDFVLDRYMGLFSESVELVMLSQNDKTYIQQLLMENAFEVTVEDDSDTSETKKILSLKDFSKVENDTIPTYYEEGLGTIAKEINAKQIKGIKVAEKVLGEKLVLKIGLLLLNDDLTNSSIDQLVIPTPIKSANFEKDTLSTIIVNWAYFHELVELHLTFGKGIQDPNTRWFRDGLADFVSHKVAQKLNPQTDSIMMKKRLKAYSKLKGNANLLKWIGTGDETKKMSGIEGDSAQYAAAMLFFIDITEKYGENIIPEMMEVIKEHRDVTSKVLIKELSRITGENIEKVLETY